MFTLSSIYLMLQETFEFTPNAQIFPRAVRIPTALSPIQTTANNVPSQLNSAIGGGPDDVFLIVGDLGSPSGEGFDFVDGMVFLERFYYVFDSENNQVGFATTPFTNSTIN